MKFSYACFVLGVVLISSINLGKRNLSDQQVVSLTNDLLTPVFRKFEDEVDAGRITYADYDEILNRIHFNVNSKHSEFD